MKRNLNTKQAQLSNDVDRVRIAKGLVKINLQARQLVKLTNQTSIAKLLDLGQPTIAYHVKNSKEANREV